MSWDTALLGFGGLALSCLGFLFGKGFSQSENILDRKREAYRDFLKVCPSPNEAHESASPDIIEMQREVGILTLYGSSKSLQFVSQYFSDFSAAQEKLEGIGIAGHPEFLKVMTSYNRMVWEMRVDAMTWSIFAPTKSNRAFKSSFGIEPKS